MRTQFDADQFGPDQLDPYRIDPDYVYSVTVLRIIDVSKFKGERVHFRNSKMKGLSYMYLLDNIFIRFGTTLHRHIVGIPMGTIAPLVANLLLFVMKEIL